MLSAEKQTICERIVNVFETGRARGDYAACVILPDGAGISYGRSQATDRSGSLDAVICRYIDLGGARAADLKTYLPHLTADESALLDPKAAPPEWCRRLMALLKLAGGDPAMQRAQDQIFEEQYWKPAEHTAMALGLLLPLSWAVVYDSCIQSGQNGVPTIRRLFPEEAPPTGGDERAWVTAYIKARNGWLLSRSNPATQRTVYRMRAFAELITAGNWNLDAPVIIRGVSVTA